MGSEMCIRDRANRVFSPSVEAIENARKIVDAFQLPENKDAGVINLDGEMVERLHLAQAQAFLEKAGTDQL